MSSGGFRQQLGKRPTQELVGTPVGLLAFEGTISGVSTVSAALGIGLAADEADIESSHAEYRLNNQ